MQSVLNFKKLKNYPLRLANCNPAKLLLAFLVRCFESSARSIRLSNVFGLRNALKINILCLFGSPEKQIRLSIDGKKFFLRKKDYGCMQIFSRKVISIGGAGTSEIVKIIDGGPFIGDSVLLFRLQYPNAQIAAVEASPANYSVLENNFTHDPNVSLFHKAIYSSSGDLVCVDQEGQSHSHSIIVGSTTENTCWVETIEISDLLDELGWERCNLLKLDIEGAEKFLFTGDQSTTEFIARVDAILFEVPDSEAPGCTKRIFDSLGDQDWITEIWGEALLVVRKDLGWSWRIHYLDY